MLDKSTRIYVAGHKGMVGSAVVRQLAKLGYTNILERSSSELDLTDQSKVGAFYRNEKPEATILAAAKVGGIHANNEYPAEFIHENLLMQCNVVHNAYLANAKRLLFLGSSCIYPKLAAQPMAESALCTGELELTNEPYAVAKIAGIKLCESYNRQYGMDFRSVMPTNLYGPGDNFHPENSHVIPALMLRIHNAKIENSPTVTIWGSGTPKREFLHVDDMAAASVHVFLAEEEAYNSVTEPQLSHINVGTGEDLSISDLAHKLSYVVQPVD
mgnify:FL=1